MHRRLPFNEYRTTTAASQKHRIGLDIHSRSERGSERKMAARARARETEVRDRMYHDEFRQSRVCFLLLYDPRKLIYNSGRMHQTPVMRQSLSGAHRRSTLFLRYSLQAEMPYLNEKL